MKLITVAMIVATVSHLSAASPIAEIGGLNLNLNLNLTLADWGIIKVPDLGLLNGDVLPILDKRADIKYVFQAFSGDHCDSGPGKTIECDGLSTTCTGTTNRHSFRIYGGPAYVSADPEQVCKNRDSRSIPGGRATEGCYNVNTGIDWRSSYTYYAP